MYVGGFLVTNFAVQTPVNLSGQIETKLILRIWTKYLHFSVHVWHSWVSRTSDLSFVKKCIYASSRSLISLLFHNLEILKCMEKICMKCILTNGV